MDPHATSGGGGGGRSKGSIGAASNSKLVELPIAALCAITCFNSKLGITFGQGEGHGHSSLEKVELSGDVVVCDVAAESEARDQGIQPGDRLLAMNGSFLDPRLTHKHIKSKLVKARRPLTLLFERQSPRAVSVPSVPPPLGGEKNLTAAVNNDSKGNNSDGGDVTVDGGDENGGEGRGASELGDVSAEAYTTRANATVEFL